MDSREFSLKLRLREGYEMTADFGMEGVPEFLMDEPAPLGAGHGPNAARVLAAAVGNCLSASLLFCLQKAHIEVPDLETEVDARLVRNEKGRWRIASLGVRIKPHLGAGDDARLARCLDLFEDFCIVTESVRRGIDVDVAVEAQTPAGAMG